VFGFAMVNSVKRIVALESASSLVEEFRISTG